MYTLILWFIRNPVAANLVMVFILAAGFLTLATMRIEAFPKLPADTIVISTTFPGAYAEQIDRQITQKIETALEDLPGVKNIYSSSVDDYSSVSVQKIGSYKLERLLEDVKLRLDSIADFPQEADKPLISRDDYDMPALYVQVYGDTDTYTLQKVGRQVKQALLSQSEISKLNIWGEKTAEVRIEVKPEILEKYQLSLSDIVTKIQQSSLTFKAGSLKTQGAEISLRADSQAYHYNDFARISILKNSNGSQLMLSDIAQIVDAYAENQNIVRFNGEATIGIEVLVGNKDNVLTTAKAVDSTLETLRKTLPADINVIAWGRSDHYIADRLTLLKNNALQGLLLVILILALFLNLKLAFWVAIGIPVSIAGTVAVMGSPWINYSLNEITTFGFIIALGIVVDDAVVIGESVFEERRHLNDPLLGTYNGVKRVATATVFGVLTSIAALLPLLLIHDALGKIFASFAGVVTLTLLFSIFESKCILPAHLATTSLGSTKPNTAISSASLFHRLLNRISNQWQQLQTFARTGLERCNKKIYRPALKWSLQHRYAVLVLFCTFAILGIGLLSKGLIRTVWFPEIPGQYITINMKMDARAPYSLTLNNVDKIEKIAEELNQKLYTELNLDAPPIKNILTVVIGAYSLEMYAELNNNKGVKTTTKNTTDSIGYSTLGIMKAWQDRVGQLEGATELIFDATESTGGGFMLNLYSKDEQALKAASAEINKYLRQIKGVRNLRESLTSGKPELYLALKPEAKHLGFDTQILASQIAFHFGGAEVQRIQRDQQEVRVIVKNQLSARDSIVDLMQTRLQNREGQWLPLTAVATIQSTYATDHIGHRNGKRVNTIAATIDKNIISPTEIFANLQHSLLPDVLARYPQVTSSVGGELEDIIKIKDKLIKILLLVCLLIFTLLAIPLKSYWQPLVIMSAIPFGFIGASIGHLIMDMPLSLLSFFGMLALTGIVVNDSLVMMVRYNQYRDDGHSVSESLISAGTSRFQAIFLTTTTTVVGLIPLIREDSESAQYLIPAAVSLAWGEAFATAITLILIPVLIAIGVDIKRTLSSFFKESGITNTQ